MKYYRITLQVINPMTYKKAIAIYRTVYFVTT